MQIDTVKEGALKESPSNVLAELEIKGVAEEAVDSDKKIQEMISSIPKGLFLQEAIPALRSYLEVVDFVAPRYETFSFPFISAVKPEPEMLEKFVAITPTASAIIERLCREELSGSGSAQVLLSSAKNCFQKSLCQYAEAKKWRGELSFECQAGSNLLATGVRMLETGL